MLDVDLIKALGNEKRLQVLDWLRDPVSNFPPQRDGDLIENGVCALFIAEKLGVSAPTCGRSEAALPGGPDQGQEDQAVGPLQARRGPHRPGQARKTVADRDLLGLGLQNRDGVAVAPSTAARTYCSAPSSTASACWTEKRLLDAATSVRIERAKISTSV